MTGTVEIRPQRCGGYNLEFRDITVWYAREEHAVRYAQDICRDGDVVVYYGDGTVKHRYPGVRIVDRSPN